MDKIDRLGWVAGISFEVFGLRIGIRVRDPRVLDLLLSRIPAGWTPLESAVVERLYSIVTPTSLRRNVRQLWVLYGDHGRLTRTQRSEDLLDYFESDLDLHIAAHSRDLLFVHAGAVRWKDCGVLIPGRSQTGKTTLVQEFLKSGAAFYSDDFATIDGAGYLHSYRRSLSVRTRNNTFQKLPPEKLGASYAEPAPISCVLLTQYAKDAIWSPRPISCGQGVLRLLENTPSARRQPVFALEVLRNAVASAEIHSGYRGEKGDTVQRVLSYLDRRSLS